MLNAKPIIITVIGISLIIGLTIAAYFKGVSDNKAKMAIYALEVDKKVAKEQVLSQKATNSIAFQFQEATDREQVKNEQINKLKSRLRVKSVCRNDGAYELWNQSADSNDLPKNDRTRKPDASRDGLELIQYCKREYRNRARQVNALQAIIRSRQDCFVQ